MTRVAVFGLGLIGGSLALALRSRRPGVELWGIDHPGVLGSDAARATAQSLIDVGNEAAVMAAVSEADLVIFATPVRAICAVLPRVLESARLVTDCGSTKRAIVAAAGASPRRGRFVPGHPMAGRPGSGLEQATADLFQDRRWILCAETSDADAVEQVESLVRDVGAEPIRLTADEHDRAVALTSHVPQVVASALKVLAARRNAELAAGPGFASATRVAGGSDAMWSDIFTTNRDEVARALRELAGELEEVALDLENAPESPSRVLELLAAARALRRR
jgi:prephenate dehydrogenase